MIVGNAFALRCVKRQSWSEPPLNIAPVGEDVKISVSLSSTAALRVKAGPRRL